MEATYEVKIHHMSGVKNSFPKIAGRKASTSAKPSGKKASARASAKRVGIEFVDFEVRDALILKSDMNGWLRF